MRFEHQLTCGCKLINDTEAMDEVRCGYHETIELTVESKRYLIGSAPRRYVD